ncbi:MAG: hypothetical protein GDA36_10335 [Rhodobacteraceae bacterium]|nr:hypothetical protein [Paracoccaceae bacterium]
MVAYPAVLIAIESSTQACIDIFNIIVQVILLDHVPQAGGRINVLEPGHGTTPQDHVSPYLCR